MYDYLREFSLGMHAGIDQLNMTRNQASVLRNATVRGTFVTQRPPYTKIAAKFDSGIQGAATQSLWQGACYFKSDDGQESFMTAVGGRLFRWIIAGQNAAVSER